LTVGYDADSELLIVNDSMPKRKAITGCRDALNGYQKGKCFFCFDDISVESWSHDIADVDHFFPHVLKRHVMRDRLDGVWNLVLACRSCNRGEKGKFAQVPELRFLDRSSQAKQLLNRQSSPTAGYAEATDGKDGA